MHKPDFIHNVRTCAIVFYKGKLVLLRHYKVEIGDYFLLPGGGWEYNELPEEGAQREVMEETGLKVKVGGLRYYKTVITKGCNTLDLIFESEVIGGNLEIKDPDKKVREIVLISSQEELDKLNFHPKELKPFLFKMNDSKFPIPLGKSGFP